MKTQPTHTPTPWERTEKLGKFMKKKHSKQIAKIISTTSYNNLLQLIRELKDRLTMQQDKYGHDNREEIGWCENAIAKAEGL